LDRKNFYPRFPKGYTVGHQIAATFRKIYKVDYEVIRNVPLLKPVNHFTGYSGKFILYQGAVNEARGLEHLVPAMKQVDAHLLIYGDGNFIDQTKKLIIKNNLSDKVLLKGKLLPEELDAITAQAYIGVNLVENIGLNQLLLTCQ
jgi:glycosyltransferase involved in cell wall biosynthesis